MVVREPGQRAVAQGGERAGLDLPQSFSWGAERTGRQRRRGKATLTLTVTRPISTISSAQSCRLRSQPERHSDRPLERSRSETALNSAHTPTPGHFYHLVCSDPPDPVDMGWGVASAVQRPSSSPCSGQVSV